MVVSQSGSKLTEVYDIQEHQASEYEKLNSDQ